MVVTGELQKKTNVPLKALNILHLTLGFGTKSDESLIIVKHHAAGKTRFPQRVVYAFQQEHRLLLFLRADTIFIIRLLVTCLFIFMRFL